MITFQTERWRDISREMQPLLRRQWEEIALDRETIPYDPDWEHYAEIDRNLRFHITTARDIDRGSLAAGRSADRAHRSEAKDIRGPIVGWYACVVSPHPHYKTTLFSFLDLFYVLPEYRKGTTGLMLFERTEEFMRQRGVKQMIAISKCHMPIDPLFERLAWRKTGTTYTKVL